ncbi:hypothetical protein RBB50_006979 [Rhinocladiella similis]
MCAGVPGVPDITRREFQLCVRTHHHWWRRPLVMQLRDLRSILKSYDTYKAEFWTNAHDARRSLSPLRNLYRSDVMRSCVTPRGRRLLLPFSLVKYIKVFSFSNSWTMAALQVVSTHGQRQRHYEILADTILILREGGFKKLSAEDIADYCLRSGSLNFLEYIREAVEMDANPVTESMRKFMVPILEEHARALLDCDWQRIPYGLRWKVEESVAEIGPKSPEYLAKIPYHDPTTLQLIHWAWRLGQLTGLLVPVVGTGYYLREAHDMRGCLVTRSGQDAAWHLMMEDGLMSGFAIELYHHWIINAVPKRQTPSPERKVMNDGHAFEKLL